MEIKRDRYISLLESKRGNGKIKIITGIRRCGKSYLMNVLFRKHLASIGVKDEHVIFIALDDDINAMLRNPLELGKYVRNLTKDDGVQYYVLLDEIQKVATIHNPYLPDTEDATISFVDVLIGLNKQPNIDIYVSGSNSKCSHRTLLQSSEIGAMKFGSTRCCSVNFTMRSLPTRDMSGESMPLMEECRMSCIFNLTRVRPNI